jgi:hypothetical protein
VHKWGEVAGLVDGLDPGHCSGVSGVDRPNPTARNVAPHEGGVQKARQGDIVDVLSMTGEEPSILLALDALPNETSSRLR